MEVGPSEGVDDQATTLDDLEDGFYFMIRVVVFTINVLAWIFSVFFICIGIWIIQEKNSLGVDEMSSTPAILLIFLGTILFLLTFTGCVGTLRENLFLLKVYMYMMVILFLIEFVTGFLAFFVAIKTEGRIYEFIKDIIKDYYDDIDNRYLVDKIQTRFECCGGYSFNDWEENIYFKCSSITLPACGVPHSCCKKDAMNSQCGFGIRTKDEIEAKYVIYVEGCIDAVKSWINEHLIIIGALCMVFAFLQLFLILLVNQLHMKLSAQQFVNDTSATNADEESINVAQ